MDVMTRMQSIDDADMFSGCMAIDLPGLECFDTPTPALPEGVRQRELHDRIQQLDATMLPNMLHMSEAGAMDLQDCLPSPAFDPAMFALPDQLNEQFTDQFMDTNFPFDIANDQTVGDLLDENVPTDLSSRVSKESSTEMFQDTPRTTNQADEPAYRLCTNSFANMATSQWPTNCPANFVPANGYAPISSAPFSCATSSSYAQPSAFFPLSKPQPALRVRNGAQQSSAINQSLVSSMLEAMDSPNSIDTFASAGMLDQYTAPWSMLDTVPDDDDDDDDDPFRRQSDSGSSGQLSNRAWQPVAQRKAVKRTLGRSKSNTNEGASPTHGHDSQPGSCMPDPSVFPFPKLRPILPRPLDTSTYEDNSREGTPTPTGQTEWLRMQMMKLMTSTPGCAAVPLRNLLNSPRAHSQPASPSGVRSPRGSGRSRPGTPRASTPKARTPRGTSTKTVFQTAGPMNSNPSRLGAATSSPTQRSKVARSANLDVSAAMVPLQPLRSDLHCYPFGKPFAPSSAPSGGTGLLASERGRSAAAAGFSGITEQVARLQQALQLQAVPTQVQVAAAPAVPVQVPAVAGAAATESSSRPQSRSSDRSTSSAAEAGVSLEETLNSLAGNQAALEAGGRLLHLQRSFSQGLSAEAMDHVLVALKHTLGVEVVYFPNIPTVLSERQVDLLIVALNQKRVWALSLGEGTSLTAAGWEQMAARLQGTALAYLYVSPTTQASIPPMARVRIRDGLHANRRAAPPRDPVLLAQMQTMSSTPQQPGGQPAEAAPELPQAAAQPEASAPLAPSSESPALAAGPGEAQAVREPSPDAAAGLPLASAAFKGAPAAAAPGAAGPGFSPTFEAAQDPPLNSREASELHGSSAASTKEAVPEAAGPRSPATSSGAEFADLVTVGLVQPGQYQLSVGAVPSINVAVLTSGGIQWEGVEFHTLAAFAQAVAQREQGTSASAQDPWKEVCLHGICLEALRQVYIERHAQLPC